MPRGIPNVKRDETGLRYTTFNIPLLANPKHIGWTYLKSETQTLWARNAKNKSYEESTANQDQRRGTQVIVLHLGSRFLRLGRASEVTPITLPTVVARKYKQHVPMAVRVEGVSRSRTDVRQPGNVSFDEKLAVINTSLRDRMRSYKLRVTPNATDIASTFNGQFQPEIIAEYNDPYRVEWTENTSAEDVYIGDEALRLADPLQAGYSLRWPIYGTNFNTRDYPSLQVILSDLEYLIQKTLKDRLNLDSKDYKNYSIILVIPDLYDKVYVRELVNLLLVTMGFKQICAQQESLAATYGAGISNACVVNIGAKMTNIACVDEGVVIADTRISLNLGGDDITEFLYVLLRRINFPYRDLDLARSYDWNVMEDLKHRLCTLAEGDVALNLYDFAVRRPDRPTEKYGLRAYDEIIMAPMCLFEPHVIEFEKKRAHPKTSFNVTEEIIDQQADRVTNAMMISIQHLLIPTPLKVRSLKKNPQSGLSTPQTGTSTTTDQQDPPAMSIDGPTPPAPPSADGVEIMDAEEDSKVPTPSQPSTTPNIRPSHSPPEYSGEIDVPFEASKSPLDVAIFNSARASGGDDKIRKYLQAVLVVGGTAHIPGMAHALESRLQAIATSRVSNMEKVQIIPPPKEVDPSVLAWKGAAVLGKMEGVSDLWVTKADWDIFGMRGLRERCFYL